jgi:competence protein ComEC
MMPLLWLSSTFIAGLLLGSILKAPWPVWLGAIAASILAAFVESLWSKNNKANTRYRQWRQVCPLPLGVVLAFFFAGMLHYPAPPQWTPQDLAYYNDAGSVTLVAHIAAMPEEDGRTTRVLLDMEQLIPSSGVAQSLHGQALADLSGSKDWQYGDELQITGEPQTPPTDETFSYRDYLQRRDIYTLLDVSQVKLIESNHGNLFWSLLYKLRQNAYTVIDRTMPQPEAALMSGILLGIDKDIPDDLTNAFQATGTAHIIAISGFNISIIAGLFFWLFSRLFGRWKAAGLSFLGVILYTLMVGAGASVVRAAIMGSMAILGKQIGRRGAGVNTLAFTAAVMCAFDPYLPWDASFQLSFMATLGLVLFADPMQEWFTGLLAKHLPAGIVQSIAGPVGDFVLLTLAAQITTLPVILLQFQRVSLSALIANPLVLPPQALLMVLGGLAVIAGMIFLPLGQLLAWLVWPLAAYTDRMVVLLSQLHWDISTGAPNLWLVIGIFALLLLGWLFRNRLRGWLTAGVLTVGLGLAVVLVWRGVLAAPDSQLHLTLAGIEDGQAILIQTPGGNAILLNGSAHSNLLASFLDQRLSPFRRQLDGLVITGPQVNALSGLSGVAEHLPIDQLYWGAAVPSDWSLRQLETSTRQQNGSSRLLSVGQAWALDQNVSLRILIDDKNGTALLLEYSGFRVLIPGGVALETLQVQAGDELQNVSVLILDNADVQSTPAQAWESLAIPAVLWNETDSPAPINRWTGTDTRGWIHVTTDGRQMQISSQKAPEH